MTQVVIRGTADVEALVRRINSHADAKALRRELYKAANRSTKGIRGRLVEAMPAALPTRGGLSGEIQKTTKWRTSAKGGRFAGVTLWARNSGHDIRTLTGARLRHPVWGNRRVWVDQTAGVEPAVFMGVFEAQKPEVQRQLTAALSDVARKVEG